jgi:NADH-quinone oxidoreductase subunit G
MLLINHPLTAGVRPAGECSLQDRLRARREHHPLRGRAPHEKIDIGPLIQLHDALHPVLPRVRGRPAHARPRVHGVLGRGDASEIGTYIENIIDNEFSGNVIDVCPRAR